MCNLYSQTKSQDAMRELFEGIDDVIGNLPPQPGIYPDYSAPIIRHGESALQLTTARWGMPTPPIYLKTKRTDPGVTNVRQANSPHWRRWLGVENRCLVPFTSFSELDTRPEAPRNHPVWFALRDDPVTSHAADRPLAFFAGIRTRWTSVRKLKDGETTDELFAFLTTDPNREVGSIHPKAMPVILTRPEDWHLWLAGSAPDALRLQRPLPDGSLHIVAEGARMDPAP